MSRIIIILCAPLLFFLFSVSFAHREEAVVEEQEQTQASQSITYPTVVKFHPPAVHFAIALPFVSLLVGALYSVRGKEPDEVEFLLLLLSSGAVIGASVTGYIAHESMEDLPIGKQALELLHTHETIGISLAFLFSLILGLRLIYAFRRAKVIHHIYMFLLLVGVLVLFFQGSLGGKLVYDFGLGVSR